MAVLSAVLTVVYERTNERELLRQRQMLVHLMATLHVYVTVALQKVVYVLFKDLVETYNQPASTEVQSVSPSSACLRGGKGCSNLAHLSHHDRGIHFFFRINPVMILISTVCFPVLKKEFSWFIWTSSDQSRLHKQCWWKVMLASFSQHLHCTCLSYRYWHAGAKELRAINPGHVQFVSPLTLNLSSDWHGSPQSR